MIKIEKNNIKIKKRRSCQQLTSCHQKCCALLMEGKTDIYSVSTL